MAQHVLFNAISDVGDFTASTPLLFEFDFQIAAAAFLPAWSQCFMNVSFHRVDR
jgi:hypothetical protein